MALLTRTLYKCLGSEKRKRKKHVSALTSAKVPLIAYRFRPLSGAVRTLPRPFFVKKRDQHKMEAVRAGARVREEHPHARP